MQATNRTVSTTPWFCLGAFFYRAWKEIYQSVNHRKRAAQFIRALREHILSLITAKTSCLYRQRQAETYIHAGCIESPIYRSRAKKSD